MATTIGTNSLAILETTSIMTETMGDTTAESSAMLSTMMQATTNSTTVSTTTDGPDNLAVIIGASVGGAIVLILLIILITYCVLKVKKKRAFEGKYSPSANEHKGGVQMNDIMTVMQPPPPERLI